MPTYEYRCTKCEHTLEAFHGMTEEPRVECPQCGARCARVITGGAGVVFKGKGFYATDHGSSSAPACGRSTRCCGRTEPCEMP
jgi:putative FmdB family regulatory protein